MDDYIYIFTNEETGAKAEITPRWPAKHFQLTKIFVPREHRKKGHGSRLLQEVINYADKYSYTLYVKLRVIDEKHGLGYDDLIQWLLRYGFRVWRDEYRRRPAQKAPRE